MQILESKTLQNFLWCDLNVNEQLCVNSCNAPGAFLSLNSMCLKENETNTSLKFKSTDVVRKAAVGFQLLFPPLGPHPSQKVSRPPQYHLGFSPFPGFPPFCHSFLPETPDPPHSSCLVEVFLIFSITKHCLETRTPRPFTKQVSFRYQSSIFTWACVLFLGDIKVTTMQ